MRRHPGYSDSGACPARMSLEAQAQSSHLGKNISFALRKLFASTTYGSVLVHLMVGGIDVVINPNRHYRHNFRFMVNKNSYFIVVFRHGGSNLARPPSKMNANGRTYKQALRHIQALHIDESEIKDSLDASRHCSTPSRIGRPFPCTFEPLGRVPIHEKHPTQSLRQHSSPRVAPRDFKATFDVLILSSVLLRRSPARRNRCGMVLTPRRR